MALGALEHAARKRVRVPKGGQGFVATADPYGSSFDDIAWTRERHDVEQRVRSRGSLQSAPIGLPRRVIMSHLLLLDLFLDLLDLFFKFETFFQVLDVFLKF